VIFITVKRLKGYKVKTAPDSSRLNFSTFYLFNGQE
jgi:hypothetical protein